jgi:ribosomal protein S18 acetylase RimI-like enzyme
MCAGHILGFAARKEETTVHALDNPIWASLSTRHRDVAQTAGALRRYPPEVAPFLGVEGAGPVDASALEALVAPDDAVFLLGPQPRPPVGWRVEHLGTVAQMVCETRLTELDGPAVVPLGEPERPAVLELTALVYPHYFRPRTMSLGRYFGIFEGRRLAAMIGERMGMPGLREVSAVCTHPDFSGRGLARRLLAYVTNDLLARGEQPFLHVALENVRAKRLYEENQFRVRTELSFWSLARGVG